MTEPRKRAAFEPAEQLLRPTGFDPAMKRPASTVAGAVLVLLRAGAGVLFLVDALMHWGRYVDEMGSDTGLTPDVAGAGLAVSLGFAAFVLLLDASFAVLIYRGLNWPRVIVMAIAVLSISASFVAWWSQGQEITLGTTLLSLALDILVLLALSSRSAAAYARRNERR